MAVPSPRPTSPPDERKGQGALPCFHPALPAPFFFLSSENRAPLCSPHSQGLSLWLTHSRLMKI